MANYKVGDVLSLLTDSNKKSITCTKLKQKKAKATSKNKEIENVDLINKVCDNPEIPVGTDEIIPKLKKKVEKEKINKEPSKKFVYLYLKNIRN